MSAPPLEEVLAPIKKRKYKNKKVAEYAIDKKGYIIREAREKEERLKKLEDRIKEVRSDLIKEGLDYNTIKSLLKKYTKSEDKSLVKLESKLYPIVITPYTRSIKFK